MNFLDADKRILLKRNWKKINKSSKNIEIKKQRKQIINNIGEFDRKYRFADEAETY